MLDFLFCLYEKQIVMVEKGKYILPLLNTSKIIIWKKRDLLSRLGERMKGISLSHPMDCDESTIGLLAKK